MGEREREKERIIMLFGEMKAERFDIEDVFLYNPEHDEM